MGQMELVVSSHGGGCFFTLLCSPTNLRIEKGIMALILPKLWGQFPKIYN